MALSKEAGYRRTVLRILAVVVPIALAVVGAALISEHPREAIVAFILALGIGVGLGYLFYFKGRGST